MVVGHTDDVAPDQQIYSKKKEPVDEAVDAHRSLGDRVRHPFPELREKLRDTHLYDIKVGAIQLKHRVGKLENLVNTNHRHDEEHEQKTDRKRTRIGESHRFQSFAPERHGNQIKWYIDGRDYFHAVSVALERAKETIYIEDWWLSPELYLRRPPHFNQEWRLDYTLKRAAERGVKIYVVLYKEVEAALTCDSAHSKHALEALCPKGSPGYGNIVVMRHPDHNVFENAGDMTFYWAHHEKFIVIDYDLAFIGGLDLCFGRWDSKQHVLADAHPSNIELEVFPGQDFNNNRIMDFQHVEHWQNNQLSKADFGRMPWHDVSMGVIGPCVYDIAEHFVLRWNFVKRDKYKRDQEYDWLTLTRRTGEDEDLIGVQRPKHPVGDYIHHPLSPLENKTGNPRQGDFVTNGEGLAEASADEDEFHDAPESLDKHGYTKEQHQFGHGPEKRFHEFMKDPHLHRPDLKTDKSLPKLPSDAKHHIQASGGDVEKQENPMMTGHNPQKEGFVTESGGVTEKEKAYTSELVGTGEMQGGQGSVHGQLVRSSADWSSGILTEQSIQNAYCEIIRGAQHYVYIENQFFITATGDKQSPVHNLIGAAIVHACVTADKEGRKFRVIIMMPSIPGFAGDLRDDAAAGTRAIMDYQYKSICRGEESIYGRIKAAGVDPTKYIFCFNLRSYDRINRTSELKRQEERSGVSYQELQQAQAAKVMPENLQGAPGEGNRPNPITNGVKQTQQRHDEPMRKFNEGKEDAGLPGVDDERKGTSQDSIAKNAMLGEGKVSDEYWPGRSSESDVSQGQGSSDLREQEKENFIQEELYIHGKVMIVDDRIVICGSSNINDRSQLGFHDSELSIVMEDTLPLPSRMNGKEYTAGHHAATLRRMLWREHLGLLPPQKLDARDDINAQPPNDGANNWCNGDEWDSFVADPLSDDLWKMWTERATTNTITFRTLFHADPDDNVKNFEQYDQFLGAKGSRKAGHLFDPFQPVDRVREELDKIKGHLVWMPLDFLRDAEMAEKGLQVNQFTESIYT